MESYNQPAFPVHPRTNPGDPHEVDWAGMTLRDWFAGQALAGVLTACAHPQSTGPYGLDVTAYTGLAFQLADAMLAARESSK